MLRIYTTHCVCYVPLTSQTVFGPAVKLHAHKDVTVTVMKLEVCVCVALFILFAAHIYIISLWL